MSAERSFPDEGDITFSEWLRENSEPAWSKATEHRFTAELIDGSLDEAVFARYLLQDYAFIETLVSVVGYAIAQAPSIDAQRELGTFLGVLTSDENDYFIRSFEALDVDPIRYTQPTIDPVTASFQDLMHRASITGGYAETLSVFVPVEWVYLEWARMATDRPDQFYFEEWISLHATPEFERFVAWLQTELDRAGGEVSPRRTRRLLEFFTRAVRLEVAFFENAYSKIQIQ